MSVRLQCRLFLLSEANCEAMSKFAGFVCDDWAMGADYQNTHRLEQIQLISEQAYSLGSMMEAREHYKIVRNAACRP